MLPKPPRCGALPPSGSNRKTFATPSNVYLPPPVDENALTIQVRHFSHQLLAIFRLDQLPARNQNPSEINLRFFLF